tara:strand:- start:1134 stop:2573 length:1440 start_codon:yes stop_codon:yes gene_type:complete
MLGLPNGLIWQGFVESNLGTAIQLMSDESNEDSAWVSFGDCLNLGTNDFTISCWFKWGASTVPPSDNASTGEATIFAKHGQNTQTSTHTGLIAMYLSGGRLKFLVYNGSSYIINNTVSQVDLTDFLAGTGPIVTIHNHDQIPVDTWSHFCVSVDRSGNCVMYLNGSPFENFSTIDVSGDSSENFDNKGHWKIGTTDAIGALPHAGAYINTFYDEYGIWNSALDADNVAAIYNSGNPIDLLVDSGNYDESSALQAYWKFGDGEGDIKAQVVGGNYGSSCGFDCARMYSIIRDQKNNGFSSELWDATQPSTGSWTAYGNNTVAIDDGAIKITYVDNELGAKATFSNATNLNTDLSTGGYNTWDSARHWYRLYLKIKVNSGSSVHVELDGGAARIMRTISPITSTEFIELEFNIEGEDATNQYLAFRGMSSGEVVWIKDISLKKLNGNNGVVEYNWITPGVGSNPQYGYAVFTSDAPIPAQT